MPFKLADWKRLAARLQLARAQVTQFRMEATDGEAKPQHLLDSAVVAVHAMAEYAVNAQLELASQKPERRHKTGDRARDLKADGRLQGDYKKILDQLESYRLAAQYLGYGRAPSVHYNATNIEECFSAVDQLVGEVAAALRASGKLE
jgi:HEPN domain-containing protein